VVAAGQQGQVAVLAAGVTARLVRVGGRTRRAGGLAARPGDSARRGGWWQEAAGSGRGDVLNLTVKRCHVGIRVGIGLQQLPWVPRPVHRNEETSIGDFGPHGNKRYFRWLNFCCTRKYTKFLLWTPARALQLLDGLPTRSQ
jgi:hypothetical protein